MSSVTASPDTRGATRTAPPTEELAARLRFGVTRLARLLRQQSDTGLTPTQLAALATIQRSGPLPVGVLAEIEQVAAPTATKVVDKLHAAGYVHRVADPDDRRVKQVRISPAGDDLLAALRARKTAWLTTRLDGLSAADRQDLADALVVLERLVGAPERSPHDPPTGTTP